MNNYCDKKILFLGGFEKMIDAVNAAHEMGLYVIVTDYLTNSPAKNIADEALMYSIDDVERIVDYCRKNRVEAVLNIFVDPAQKPYQQICEALGLPCYGTKEQFQAMTDKSLFKLLCAENGVDVIPEYHFDEEAANWREPNVKYPVYIKPTDKYASKGQSVCNNLDEVQNAIAKVKRFSESTHYIAEQYMTGDDFTVKYRFDGDKIDVIWTADRYLHISDNELGKVAICHGMPSKYTQLYFENVHDNVCAMFHSIGMKSGEAFLQGFVDGNTIRFYDPAFRFSGGQTYRIIDRVFHTRQLKEIIGFALTGEMTNEYSSFNKDLYLLDGKRAVFLMPTMRAGKIKHIIGIDQIIENPAVVGLTQTHYEGECVIEDGTAQQRIAYIHVVTDSKEEMIKVVEWIGKTLSVLDMNGKEMLTQDFDAKLLDY